MARLNLSGASLPERDPSASEGARIHSTEDLVVVESVRISRQRAVKKKVVPVARHGEV
jgi:hypothetical protein